MVDVHYRPWTADDEPFLWDMLYLSLHVRAGHPPFERSVMSTPSISHYLIGFGDRAGDDAQVCVGPAAAPVGAAWCRRFDANDPGYGFVDSEVPELGMAVSEQYRGRGVGRTLLTQLLVRNATMSLSVDAENQSAVGLYLSLGFIPLTSAGGTMTMIHR